MSKPSPARYRTLHFVAPARVAANLVGQGHDLVRALDGSLVRPVLFSDTAIQFRLTIKVLFKLPLRQTTGLASSLLKMSGLDWAVPDYTTRYRVEDLGRPDPEWAH